MPNNTPAPADLVEAVRQAIADPGKYCGFRGELGMVSWQAQAAIAAYQAHMASDGVVQADGIELAFTLGFEAGAERIMHLRDPKDCKPAPSVVDACAAYMAKYQRQPDPRDAVSNFIDTIHRASPDGGYVWVQHHPNGEWVVADQGRDPRDAEIERLREALAAIVREAVDREDQASVSEIAMEDIARTALSKSEGRA